RWGLRGHVFHLCVGSIELHHLHILGAAVVGGIGCCAGGGAVGCGGILGGGGFVGSAAICFCIVSSWWCGFGSEVDESSFRVYGDGDLGLYPKECVVG